MVKVATVIRSIVQPKSSVQPQYIFRPSLTIFMLMERAGKEICGNGRLEHPCSDMKKSFGYKHSLSTQQHGLSRHIRRNKLCSAIRKMKKITTPWPTGRATEIFSLEEKDCLRAYLGFSSVSYTLPALLLIYSSQYIIESSCYFIGDWKS